MEEDNYLAVIFHLKQVEPTKTLQPQLTSSAQRHRNSYCSQKAAVCLVAQQSFYSGLTVRIYRVGCNEIVPNTATLKKNPITKVTFNQL